MNQFLNFLTYVANNYPPAVFALVTALLGLLGFICLILIWFLFDYISNFLRQSQHKKSRRRQSLTDAMEIELLKRCRGDKELAIKLFRQTKERYPDRKDKEWLLYKTLGDLERGQATAPKYTPRKPTTAAASAKPQQQNNITLKTNGVLESKILRLLQGDRDVAIRLLKNVKQRNPGQSYEWYLQKVIWDLERDRRI